MTLTNRREDPRDQPNPLSYLRRLDLATALQGATAGLSMTLVAFLIASESIVLAGIMSAAVSIGMISSRLFRRTHPRTLSLVMTAARALAVFAAYHHQYTIAILLAAVAGMSSRRLFLDLKHQVGDIKPSHLVTHGARNSIGFGIGAAAAGLLLPFTLYAQLAALLVGVAAVVAYPDADKHDVEEATGLTRRDLVASVVFSFASTPLGNGIAPALLIGSVGSQVAGISCFAFTVGSLLAPRLARLLGKFPKPVAVSTAAAGLTFIAMIVAPYALVVYLSRLAAGALLYAGQGIMEMRTHRENEDGKGLELLWSLLSAANVIASIAIPFTVEHSTLWTAPLWTLLGALLIFNLTRIPGLR